LGSLQGGRLGEVMKLRRGRPELGVNIDVNRKRELLCSTTDIIVGVRCF
jgi:hypothetical protein